MDQRCARCCLLGLCPLPCRLCPKSVKPGRCPRFSRLRPRRVKARLSRKCPRVRLSCVKPGLWPQCPRLCPRCVRFGLRPTCTRLRPMYRTHPCIFCDIADLANGEAHCETHQKKCTVPTIHSNILVKNIDIACSLLQPLFHFLFCHLGASPLFHSFFQSLF